MLPPGRRRLRDKTGAHRIADNGKHDRDRVGLPMGRRCYRSGRSENDIGPERN
jgi:hypothetical protein